ncbi:MAG TPA: hypothetical protein VLY23_01820 [Candidatus Acidoferrum sp.]|nr:hypothetical protein [Candidatus Acidoferrum sp.]
MSPCRATMRAAIGIRAHSGWAAVVAAAGDSHGVRVLERQRIAAVDSAGFRANQPYHFVEKLPLDEAQGHLDRCEKTAVRLATAGLESIVKSLGETGHRVVGCGILQASGRPLPELGSILASHAMIHTAEGEFFRDAFARACEQLGIPVSKIRERELFDRASAELRTTGARLKTKVTKLGRELGPPWTQDQKGATLAAWLLLAGEKRRR